MTDGWIDISIPLENGMVHWPGDLPFERTEALKIANGDECNLSQLSTGAHIGTHMDAPRHFLPDGASIDTLPIEATVGRARVIEIHDPYLIRVQELEQHRLSQGERILLKTANSGTVWKTHAFQKQFVYIDSASAAYLAGCGIRTLGVDYLSVGGFEKDSAETHRILLGAGIWIVEGLNLEHVAPGDYDFICLPLRLMGADGAPARAVLKKAT